MSNSARKLLGATAAAEDIDISDYFSTYLYTGTGSTQTITNGIDLAGEGGLVWTKMRNSGVFGDADHWLFDTERGVEKKLSTNTTGGQGSTSGALEQFNSDGYQLGYTGGGFYELNYTGEKYASWTFRKAERFFDVVTYTGTGSVQNIAHNLGVVPGCIIVKRLDSSSFNWQIYHRSSNATPEDYRLEFTTDGAQLNTNVWGSTPPTSTHFTVGANGDSNGAGGSLVAYLFAHDPLGPSGDGSDGLIACGSYTGNGSSTGPVIDLGWEPQWALVKRASSAGDWALVDSMRSFGVSTSLALEPNSSAAESTATNIFGVRATGFQVISADTEYNASGNTYIYIAIRRGPMREPTSGTEVFSVNTSSAATGTKITTGFPVDMQILAYRSGTAGKQVVDRMRGVSTNTTGSGQTLYTTSTAAEAADAGSSLYWDNTGFQMPSNWGGISDVFWNFRRAPGFFDVVAYTGDGVAGRTVSHNLGVAPEMMIVKRRDSSTAGGWNCYHSALGETKVIFLQSTNAASTNTVWNNTAPTATLFTLDASGVNNSSPYIAYLFATLPGVSKVGSYTGNGSTQTIDCGFTAGARFVLIKRTDTADAWYVWDSARGIVAGNDPYLQLNSTAAEVTSTDHIDPANSGFTLATSFLGTNNSAGTYIYLAIA